MEDQTDLLKKYNQNRASDHDRAIVEQWHLQFDLSNRKVLGAEETAQDLDEVRRNLLMLSVVPKKRRLWLRLTAAAAILLLISSIAYLWLSRSPERITTDQLAKNDLPPGRKTATLTLADGSRIVLNPNAKGRIASEHGVVIEQNDQGHLIYNGTNAGSIAKNINILSTARGEEFQVSLPDGTKVWLNAASRLEYPSNFQGLQERNVKLIGEAYFEVAKDKAHPFVVQTERQRIAVLGTHFNVNAYQDEALLKTTLFEGLVRVNENMVLKPGQQAISDQAGKIYVGEADLDAVLAWKDGFFNFKQVPLPQIMRQISRWYNLEVVYEGNTHTDTFSGVIDRNASLSRILKILEKGGVEFHIEGRKLFVTN
ncbi:FecR family protein [Pedobacter jeongneungensis]|uniref:FecR family protein n=1 Tax=Pedobacter jeongneungensis TaxID=947309 RepID=UPI00046AD555|nr:FecR family protein [Pedobacter jeongneungensis]